MSWCARPKAGRRRSGGSPHHRSRGDSLIYNEDGFYEQDDPSEILRRLYLECPEEMIDPSEQDE